MARTRTGTEIKLLKGLGDDREARGIEQQIEQALGIADRPVRGEAGRE